MHAIIFMFVALLLFCPPHYHYHQYHHHHYTCRRKNEDEPDPEEIKRNLERLELIKKKREEDRLKRIQDEGWDRYAPESDTNRR